MSTLLLKGALSARATVSVLFAVQLLVAQPSSDRLAAEHNPSKRSALALDLAASALEDASDCYKSGNVHKGDAELEEMTKDLRECVSSLRAAHKSGNYKKAELKVASLQRRLHDLVSDLSIENRGWAEQTERTVDEIHDQILTGVMTK
jgi:polyhydroxyalkanoate synthesis regulator phasin